MNFHNYEDIWWKLSEIKNSNKILEYYDENIHKILINLLNNDNWKINHKNLKKYLKNKIEN